MSDLKDQVRELQRRLRSAHEAAKDASADAVSELLLQARENLQDIAEGIGALQDEQRALKQSLELKPQLVPHKGVYWKRDDPDPWCARCWEVDHRAVHLGRSDVLAGRLLTCPRCGASVNLDFVSPPKRWP